MPAACSLGLSVLVLIAGGTAGAADAPKAPAPPPCSAAEHRQFDFRLGDWEVRDPAGKVVGRNRITTLHKGCAVRELERARRVTGSSFNIYDAERKAGTRHGSTTRAACSNWKAASATAGWCSSARRPPRDESDAGMNRITWQALPDGRVRQLWETSTDRGVTWKTAFDGFYRKQK